MTNDRMRQKYEALWKRMGGKGDGNYWRIEFLYSSPNRAHHTIDNHILPMLEEFESVAYMSTKPDAVRMAIVTHDAFLDTRARDNEERSAVFTYNLCSAGGIEDASCAASLVRSTDSCNKPSTIDEMLLHDCDYAIIGQPWQRFMKYHEGIDFEYSWLNTSPASWKRFKERRNEFLASLKSGIYMTPYFKEKYEAKAQENIERILSQNALLGS
jgi:predicted metal-dependent HD superfamily phosphohydrolase